MILGRLGPGQVGPGQLEADTQDSDLHTFVKKLNLRSASILGNFRDGNQNIKGLITSHLYGQ